MAFRVTRGTISQQSTIKVAKKIVSFHMELLQGSRRQQMDQI